MGLGIQELLIILVIVLLIFGTRKLRSLGSDLGGAVKGFRDAQREGSTLSAPEDAPPGVAKKTRKPRK